jgi:putative flavoprotein involved in K+ transport
MHRMNEVEPAGLANDVLDVLVIGGGQAGLAMGYYLAQRGLRFEILDAGSAIGEAWSTRWDSLRLFTPAQYDNLPGLAFPATPDTYPGKDDVADYLQSYVSMHTLPVRLNAAVTSLRQQDDMYVASVGDDTFHARQVVIATGPFQVPFVPSLARSLGPDVVQMHSVDYRNPAALPPGKVLVVGGANTGSQIAEELSATRSVDLAVGQRMPVIPQRPFGRDVWWWLTRLGLDRVTVASRLGKRMSTRDVVIGNGPKRLARHHGVHVRPRMTGANGRTVTFADGGTAEVDVVVWATGFTTDHSWIDVPGAKDAQGRIVQQRGVTASPGLYTLGLSWQHTRTSALLGWVGNDAAWLAGHIAGMHAVARERTGTPAEQRAQPAAADLASVART